MSGPSSEHLYGRTTGAFSHLLAWSLLGLAVICFLAFGCRREAMEGSDPAAALLGTVRPGEGRLAGAPWLVSTPGARPQQAVFRRASRAAARALEEKVTTDTLRADAVVKLLGGEVDAAIDQLSRSTDLAPLNATLWSDLAAAHLQRSEVASDPYEIVRALAAANRAVRLNPALVASRFNRALALERLSLGHQAALEWQLVDQMERDPLWAREARTRAQALRQRNPPDWERELAKLREAVQQKKPDRIRAIVAGAPQRFREHLEEKALAAWVKAESDHREPEAAAELAVAEAIGDVLVALGGDRMAADTIAHIEQTRASDIERFQRLVNGFLTYFEGLDLTARNQFSPALPYFQEAHQALAREYSPFAYWALYRIALCHYQAAEYRQAIAISSVLAERLAGSPYKALQGRSLSLIGLIHGIEGSYATAISLLDSAKAAFQAVKEAPNAAKADATLSTIFDTVGQRREAWSRIYSALTTPTTFEAEIRFFTCVQASWLARREDETEIALWFQEEVIRNAPALGKPQILIGALRQNATLLAALGKHKEASAELARARQALPEISDPPIRQSVEGDLLLAESEVAGTRSPHLAIAKLDEAIRIFRKTFYHRQLGYAFYQRALAHKALGRHEDAERDLSSAIAELEQQREGASVGDRISYFDRVKEVFDTMIELQLEQRRQAGEALRFSEQAKARVLWDWIVTAPVQETDLSRLKPSQPVDLQRIQRDLPEGTAVIEYAVLPTKVIVWVFRREGALQHATVEIGERDLDHFVQRFRRALLEKRSQDFEAISEEAYTLLIRPVAHHLAPGERLVLIPDGALHLLPFSLLRNGRTREYLIQERVLTTAPSARVYVASRRRELSLTEGPGQVLVVADPDFDRDIDPTLLPLQAGDTEASIAQIFPGSRVLRGPAATREAFLQASGEFEILHFGGHSVVNVNFPLLSQMLFAKAPGDPARGVLYSGDVLRQRFPRIRLAVLASCGTALGKVSRTEGVQNLARPFLAAGVPTVVAALWDVDDQTTADFFVRFYQNLKQRPLDVAGALQATQIESIGRGADPRVWGAFEVIGTDRLGR